MQHKGEKNIIILSTIILLSACDADVTTENSKGEERKEQEENPILTLIEERSHKYGASLQNVKVNDDAENEGEYLMFVTFGVLNKKDTNKQYEDLHTFSSDLAYHLSQLKEINTLIIFWKTPDRKDNILKVTYKREGEEMFYSDEYKDVNYFGI